MSNLMEASRQWATRPWDERFVGLLPLQKHTHDLKARSGSKVVANKQIKVVPMSQFTKDKDDVKGLAVVGPAGNPIVPTYWAFSQLGRLTNSPVGWFREQEVPAPLVADAINWGLVKREVEDVQLLARKESDHVEVAAFTGPGYGRIWNADVVDAMIQYFGDGLTGHFRVPGEFGKKVEVTKDNTTIYAGDEDMFVFLADEERRIEIPDRRDGKGGSLARGFFLRNSEVGSGKVEITGFLFDYVCCNRIVWGAQDVKKIEIRHTAGAPTRWLGEAVPALQRYTESSTKTMEEAIKEAREHKLAADVQKFLRERFTNGQAKAIMDQHMLEEHRPIETRWDAVVGITAYAKSIPWQNDRIKFEREAGKLMAV